LGPFRGQSAPLATGISVTERISESSDEFASRSYPIREDMAVQQRDWIMERCGWLAMATVLFFALLGLFSRGPLSDAVAAGPGGNPTIAYDRFVRSQAETRFAIAGSFDGENLELRLGRGFLDAYELRAIQPEPTGGRSDSEAVYYSFPLREPGAPIRITIDAKRVGWGSSAAEFGFGAAPGIAISQFAYP
jgi:hypothetical protein